MTTSRALAGTFQYVGYAVDPERSELTCHYALDGRPFTERISLPAAHLDGERPLAGRAALEAARLVFLLAGVSYYKAGAPPVVDLGDTPLREGEREFLHAFYTEGLGEFAYRNGLDLELRLAGGAVAGPAAPCEARPERPLVPFGGGLDSIVSVELVRAMPGPHPPELFVVSPPGGMADPIEAAAAVTGLPVVRAVRALDPAILRSGEEGFLNGHVPVTGILSAIAVLAAVAGGHGVVVMSNEWSASAGNVEIDGRTVNHQYSKSASFENGFRAVLATAFEAPPRYFSLLRSCSTLWIAERFASLRRYHAVFRSCNRAFAIDPELRLANWCGRCDKCCFVDLVLAPFMPRAELAAVFGGREPLENPDNLEAYRALLALSGSVKPFECVGDVGECRSAAVLAARRPDRTGNAILASLLAELGESGVAEAHSRSGALLRRLDVPDNVPARYAAVDLLV